MKNRKLWNCDAHIYILLRPLRPSHIAGSDAGVSQSKISFTPGGSGVKELLNVNKKEMFGDVYMMAIQCQQGGNMTVPEECGVNRILRGACKDKPVFTLCLFVWNRVGPCTLRR